MIFNFFFGGLCLCLCLCILLRLCLSACPHATHGTNGCTNGSAFTRIACDGTYSRPGGCTANLTVSRVSPKPQRKIRVFQRDTYVSIDYAKQSMELYQRVPKPDAPKGEATADILRKRLRLKKEDMLTLELDDFIQTVREGRTPQVTGEHARDALHLAIDIAKQIGESSLRKKLG